MTITPPPIVQIPGSPANTYSDRQGFAPEAIVLHIAEGPIGAVDNWFANPKAQAGAHFCVGKNGAVHQYFQLDQAPFANGKIENGYTAKLVDANRQANPNFWSISIEHEGKSGEAAPDAQLNASVRLSAWLWVTAILPGGASGLALDRDHILCHRDISPQSRPRCPGWSETFIAGYIRRVQACIDAPPIDHMHELIDALTRARAGLTDLQGRATAQIAGIDAVIARFRDG
jgi:N-acetyl-anhydromuramyl-L-alanine amidase AmpD